MIRTNEDKCILVIDDCEVTRTALKKVLEKSFCVVTAKNGNLGIKKVSDSIGLVLLDLILPDCRGIDVLRKIKQAYPSIPVVIITGHSSEDICIEAFRRGARDYIKKPFQAEEILRKVEILMYIHDMQKKSRKAIPISNIDSIEKRAYPKHIRTWILNGILSVKDFIDNNPSMPIDLTYASKMAGINRSYFCKYFKEITGLTFKDYLVKAKFTMAKNVLKDRDADVRDAAEVSGYNPKYFAEAFKRECGVRPKDLKK
ncbi:MAG: DNA-binding response regulator [Dissulfurispiraceae bacterium]|jgi:YesN/AraC family two-component response regulator|nr:DNA-binding response regulator [Dissulfurispiraceae bacterium]